MGLVWLADRGELLGDVTVEIGMQHIDLRVDHRNAYVAPFQQSVDVDQSELTMCILGSIPFLRAAGEIGVLSKLRDYGRGMILNKAVGMVCLSASHDPVTRQRLDHGGDRS